MKISLIFKFDFNNVLYIKNIKMPAISPTLDTMVNEFKDYANKNYNCDDKKRNEIIYLYNMKENYKNERPGEDGKVPTVEDIMHCIYYLRWERILPF